MTLSAVPPGDLPTHPVLEALRDTVLPNLRTTRGHVVPAAGREVKDSGEFFDVISLGMHAHEDFEWMCLLDSFSHIRVGQAMHRLTAGDCCLLAPHVRHA